MEPSLSRPSGGSATRAVHGATTTPEVAQHPLAPAIWPAATWAVDASSEIAELLDDERPGYVYGRYDTPTQTSLHTVHASLHGAPAAWSVASGTAAIHAALGALRGQGRVLAATRLYGGTFALLRRLERDAGWEVDHAELLTGHDLDGALTAEHTVVHVETVANPSTAVADLPALAEVARARGVALVVDDTFASPYLCRPYELGATVVVESATKLLGGHGDVVAGMLVGDQEVVHAARHQAIELGGSLGAFEAWLVLRGIQTLALRVREACANASALAEVLADDARVEVVRYPGLPDHPQHELAARLFDGRGFGTVLSFDLADRGAAERFADACEVLARAVSLGGTHSLVLHPASTSHRQLDDAGLAAAGLGPGTVRLSVGVEDRADLVDDVRRALDAGAAGSAR